ncbi:phage tail protein [Achromobacter ruhlandii]|uniref:phage tail protein n=1 Tax=Achromobacter ruhlandii TaxID=72557 RepID=UPI003B9FF888
MAITSLPTPPSRSDPENFPERADAFMAALPRFATEANALQEHVNEAAAAVDQDAAAAAQSRDAAAESKGQANQSAVNAELARQAAAEKAGEAGTSALLAQQWATKMGAPVEGDGFSAKHWAEIAAMGAGLPIYMPGSLPPQNVGPIYIAGQGNAEWDAATGRYRVHSDIPVGAVAWWPLRASVPAGRIPADGQTISRATFPDLAAMVAAGTVPVATESDWLADPRNRGCYTVGDGSTTIRVPDLNGRSTGSLGRMFLSGDGADSNGVWGVIQLDQFQNHNHLINIKTTVGGAGQAFGQVDYGLGVGSQYSTVDAPVQNGVAAGVPRVGNKTHPQNVTGVWTIQAFGAVTNPGAADAAQLATDYAALNAAFQSVRGQLLGVGQVWQNLTASRSLDVTYINTTGRPIIVQVYCISTVAGGYSFFAIDEVPAGLGYYPTTSGTLATYGVVPAGSKYRVSVSGANLNTWREHR